MKEIIVVRKLTPKECLELFKKKQELIEKRNKFRQELREKRISLYNASHDIEDLTKDIDKKIPKFIAGLK